MCMDAVKQEPYTLNYIKNQTDEICVEAVKQNELSVCFVNDRYKYLFNKN